MSVVDYGNLFTDWLSTERSVKHVAEMVAETAGTGVAMNKEGLTAEHYLSPLSSEHAIDDYYGDQ
jgi:hypothetical protein